MPDGNDQIDSKPLSSFQIISLTKYAFLIQKSSPLTSVIDYAALNSGSVPRRVEQSEPLSEPFISFTYPECMFEPL